MVKEKCSAYIHYTDVKGERHKFVLTNVYICSAVRVPLISVSHLVSRNCEVHMTKSGHTIVFFPDNSVSELVTMRNGLITLMPYSSKECRSLIKKVREDNNDRQANIVQVTDADSDDDMLPPLVSDASSDSLSEESFTDVSDDEYEDPRLISDENEDNEDLNSDRTASITLKEANDVKDTKSEAHDQRVQDNKTQFLNKTYSLLNNVERGVQKVLTAKLKGPLNWMWTKLRGRDAYTVHVSKKITKKDDIRKKVYNEVSNMISKVSAMTLENNTANTKDVGCNTSVTRNKKTFTIGTDATYTHAVFNHRDPEVIKCTLERTENDYHKLSKIDQARFMDELREVSHECILCLAVSNRCKVLRRTWSAKRTPKIVNEFEKQDLHNTLADEYKTNLRETNSIVIQNNVQVNMGTDGEWKFSTLGNSLSIDAIQEANKKNDERMSEEDIVEFVTPTLMGKVND